MQGKSGADLSQHDCNAEIRQQLFPTPFGGTGLCCPDPLSLCPSMSSAMLSLGRCAVRPFCGGRPRGKHTGCPRVASSSCAPPSHSACNCLWHCRPNNFQAACLPRCAERRGGWHWLRGSRASNAALIRACMHVAEQITEAILGATDDAGIKELTKQLIESDPETQETLKRYQEAMARVERCGRVCHACRAWAGCWVCACSGGMMYVSLQC